MAIKGVAKAVGFLRDSYEDLILTLKVSNLSSLSKIFFSSIKFSIKSFWKELRISFISFDSSGKFRCKKTLPYTSFLYDDLEINSQDVIHITQYRSYPSAKGTGQLAKIFQYNTSCNKTGDIVFNEMVGPMAIDSSDNIWVWKDPGAGGQIVKFDPVGTYLGTQGMTNACLTTSGGTKATRVYDMEADSSGNIYFIDHYCNNIVKYDTNINYVTHFGSYGTSDTQWRYSFGFDIYNDQIYLADYYGKRIL